MKILCLVSLLILAAQATDYSAPDFPDEPTPAMVLEANKLKDADEMILLRFVESHWDSAGFWLADVSDKEEATIRDEYFKHLESRDGNPQIFLTKAITKLQKDRLRDQRRIVDAALRKLGQRGTEISLPGLISRSKFDERPWVGWKALASVQEILPRVDPTRLDDRTMMNIDAPVVAPLLRDLDPDVADRWAWTLWEHHKKWLMVSFRERVPLLTRILLAGAFAPSHPIEAAEVFDEGLRSHDPALRTVAEMVIRSGIGSSLPYEISSKELMEAFKKRKWTPKFPLWEALPLPLDQPLLRRHWGGRRDLIWLDDHTEIKKRIEDVWPDLGSPLPNGLFYSKGKPTRLLDAEGRIHARFQSYDWSGSSLSIDGGLWGYTRLGRAAETLPDGSLVWEGPLFSPAEYREIASIGNSRIVLLGYKFFECRNRRGDLLWKTSLDKLDDPREIIAISDNRFLLSCKKSVGWLTVAGDYEPILAGLGSSGWIRYHPTEPWVVMDGATNTAIIYNPKSKKEVGRFDLDDGGTSAKSRFLTPSGYISE